MTIPKNYDISICMINGILDLCIFEILDEIALTNRVNAATWAKESGLKHSPRISELRKMAQLKREGRSPSSVGRAFSVNKCQMALCGLIKILGEDIVTKALLDLLKKAKNRKERILVMALALSTDQEANVEMYLETVLKANLKK